MRVAVVIPCHNVEDHVAAALDSLAGQRHAELDVVCVDDGSTDGTLQVLKAYGDRFPHRLTVISQQQQGASAARNAGMALATGDLVQFLDADDLLDPEKIAGQVAIAQATGADVVIGDFEQVMPDGALLPALSLHDHPWMALIRTRMGTTSSNLWRRSALETVGGWNAAQQSSQDYELLFRLLKQRATMAWDRNIRTHVIKRSNGSISRTDMPANWDRYIALRRDILEHLRATDPEGSRAEIECLRQYIFMALRIVATYDRPKAVREYQRSVGKGFSPQVGRAITERYALLHNLFGFATTERLLHVVKTVRS